MFGRTLRRLASLLGLSNRRRGARYRVSHGARLIDPEGRAEKTRVLDVSTTGLRLVCRRPLAPEALVQLRLYFQGEALDRQGRVVRCTPEPYGGWEIGLALLPTPEECREALVRYYRFARWLSGHLTFAM